MMNKTLHLILVVLVAMSVLSAVHALAGDPKVYSGKVTLNGKPAPDGLLVEARIDGVKVDETKTKNGVYGDPNNMQTSDPDFAGKFLDFYIKDRDNNFVKAGSVLISLDVVHYVDLVASGNFFPPVTPPSSSGGSGGSKRRGGSSSSFTPEPESADELAPELIDAPEPVVSCDPDWFCSEWSACVAGKEKRTCVDNNFCSLELGKPIESQECVVDVESPSLPPGMKERGFFSSLTGAVVGGGATSWLSLLALLAIIGGLVMLARKNK